MTPAEAILEIRGYASAGRIVVTGHARRRMRERGVEREDLRHALVTAASCEREEAEKWRVRSSDLDGDELQLIVVIEQGVIVVTLF